MTYRHRGTTSQGEKFTKDRIDQAWSKACGGMHNHDLIEAALQFFSEKFKEGSYCLDDYGHIISRDEYGQESRHGWEIDHICPVAKKDTYEQGAHKIDEPENLRALHWESNKRKGRLDSKTYELEWEWVVLNKAA
ncbi:MAG TPA: hypothetical protein DD412_07105 [Holosporales bacterium]|nr:hypothetical protein [Holosporales bacterium]